MNRLTTDTPHGNSERLLNLAYTKDREVWLRVDGGRKLTDVTAEYAKQYGCVEANPEDIMDGACLDCDCPISLMYALAVQAAELRTRLSQYEDTGLTPEECEKSGYIMTAALDIAANCSPDMMLGRLKEIICAEAAGRLLVLPCDFGDTIYRVVVQPAKTKTRWGKKKTAVYIRDCVLTLNNVQDVIRNLGKTVFLTKAEAKAAAEVQKGIADGRQ